MLGVFTRFPGGTAGPDARMEFLRKHRGLSANFILPRDWTQVEDLFLTATVNLDESGDPLAEERNRRSCAQVLPQARVLLPVLAMQRRVLCPRWAKRQSCRAKHRADCLCPRLGPMLPSVQAIGPTPRCRMCGSDMSRFRRISDPASPANVSLGPQQPFCLP